MGALAVSCLLGSGFAGGVAAAAPGAADRTVEAIVGVHADTTLKQGRRLIRRHGGEVTGRLRIIRALTARISSADADLLQAHPRIASVSRNAGVATTGVNVKKLASAYPQASVVTEVWNNLNLTGRGIGVAVLDTGVAGDLPDFRTNAKDATSRVVASAVVHPDATTAGDAFGHGTHVAGIIAGNGTARVSTDPLFGRRIGIAPDAHVVSVKVSDDAGAATVIDVIRGLQFAVDNKDALGIRVVNLSLESTEAQSYKTDPLAAAVEAAWFKGLVVVAAAGNRGDATDAVTRAPGNDPFVLTVGGFDDRSTLTAADDEMATWSSRGKTQDGFAKPEVFAPGSKVVSNLAPRSKFESLCPSCTVDGQYIRAGGTSMSAPMVSGLVTLMLEKNPKLTPDQVKGIILSETRSLPGGIPAIDGLAAVRKASSSTGKFPLANQGIVPNDLIDPSTGDIDYTRSSWSRSSWSSASGALTAGWARSSWSCSCLSGEEDKSPTGQEWTRSSWSRSSWSTAWGL